MQWRAESLAALVVAGMIGAAPAVAASKHVTAEADAVFAAYTASTPGCVVGVEQAGKVLFAKGYGLADVDASRPLTPESKVYMASVSKQVAAMAVLLLVDDGKLRLTDPVRATVPELPAYADRVTVGQLLNHTSGVRDYFTLGALKGLPPTHPYTEGDVLGLLAEQKGLSFEPGTDFLYSNSGYVLLSIIVQRVSKQRLDDFARARMFTPLGMTGSRFQHDHTAAIPEKASGYQGAPTHWVQSNSYLDVVGDGGLYSSVDDMLKWLANLDRPKVGAQALARMRAPALLSDRSSTGYGMGLSPSSYRGLEVVGHSGGLAGYRTEDWWFPAEKLGVVVLYNRADARSGELTGQLAAVFLKDRMKPATAPPAGAAAEAGQPFAGVYRYATGQYAEFAVRGAEFVALRPDRPLAQVAPGVFVVQSNPDAARIAFDGLDRVRFIAEHQPVRVAERVMPTTLAPEAAADFVGDYASLEGGQAVHLRPGMLVVLGDQPTGLSSLKTGADRLWIPQLGFEIVFGRDGAGEVSGLTLNAGRARPSLPALTLIA